MQPLRSGLAVLSAVLLCSLIVIGGFSLSLVEATRTSTASTTAGNQAREAAASPSTPEPPSPTPSIPATQSPILPGQTPSLTVRSPNPGPTTTRSLLPSSTPKASPTPKHPCVPPQGWIQATLQPGDTLEKLGRSRGASPTTIVQGNCLTPGSTLAAGSPIYLPSEPSATPTLRGTLPACKPADGWILYAVQAGDTLFEISLRFSTSVADLQRVNCLGRSTIIHRGDLLYVPGPDSKTIEPTATPKASGTIPGNNSKTPTRQTTGTKVFTPSSD